ncbi:hypothetical protein K504DRAFT_156491 [Pleomassaria siparia CBS 279.74]|uniref:Uncharacterized protein n=1 Tax=Pleomassaria siparia CBS 279.74 TaxID=1314801 RepID=A0A6G1KNT7_9PLEO|nr:hypothetical protein K504DRAFT_156491 [Pleomassaria siparia CBS 279.74]
MCVCNRSSPVISLPRATLLCKPKPKTRTICWTLAYLEPHLLLLLLATAAPSNKCVHAQEGGQDFFGPGAGYYFEYFMYIHTYIRLRPDPTRPLKKEGLRHGVSNSTYVFVHTYTRDES